jgi:predicted amidophosphoribosyltransferase
MRVICRAQYLSEPVPEMRPQDYASTHLVKAVKGLELHPKSFERIIVAGRNVKITEGNKDEAIGWFAEWCAPQIDGLGTGQKILIPIPGSKAIASLNTDFRTAQIARSVAAHCANAAVVPILRWREEMIPSHAGGPRDQRVLYPKLVVTGRIPKGRIVLIDDMYTTGGHLVAAAWRLEDQNRVII